MMRNQRKLTTHKHGFEGRNIRESNWYDDTILDSSRMRHVMKGHRRELHMREFNAGRGDAETFYRAVAVLMRLWDDKDCLRGAIVRLADMCVMMSSRGDVDEALSTNQGVWILEGVDLRGLSAWGAACWIRGAGFMDCSRFFDRAYEEGYRVCLARMFDNFDMLDERRYTEKDFREILGDYDIKVV